MTRSGWPWPTGSKKMIRRRGPNSFACRSSWPAEWKKRERLLYLESLQAELLKAFGSEWSAPFLEVLDGKENRRGGWTFFPSDYDALCADHWWGCCVFRRGFAEYFHLPAKVMIRHGEKLARLTPIRELYLNPWDDPNIESMRGKPWLASLTALYGPSGLQWARGG